MMRDPRFQVKCADESRAGGKILTPGANQKGNKRKSPARALWEKAAQPRGESQPRVRVLPIDRKSGGTAESEPQSGRQRFLNRALRHLNRPQDGGGPETSVDEEQASGAVLPGSHT